MMNAVGLVHDPQSRGSVEAVSLDASKPPRVTANYFAATGDNEKVVGALKALINVASQKALAPWRTSKAFEPPTQFSLTSEHADSMRNIGLNVSVQGIPDFLACLFKEPSEKIKFITLPCLPEDDSKWGDFLRDNVLSTYHYFGTAAVGSVVESGSFKVKDTEGLFVIDASVIPYPPRINPVGTIMTLGHFVGSKLAKSTLAEVFV